MLALGRRLVEGRVSHLNLLFHSSSLRPGLTPFVASQDQVRRLYDRIEAFVAGLAKVCSIEFKTVAEVASSVVPMPVTSASAPAPEE